MTLARGLALGLMAFACCLAECGGGVASSQSGSHDSGSGGATSASSVLSGCLPLSACCATLTGSAEALCNEVVQLGNATGCGTELGELQRLGSCTSISGGRADAGHDATTGSDSGPHHHDASHPLDNFVPEPDVVSPPPPFDAPPPPEDVFTHPPPGSDANTDVIIHSTCGASTCATGASCVNGACRCPSPDGDEEGPTCGAPNVCFELQGTDEGSGSGEGEGAPAELCAPPCASNADCPAYFVCQSGACSPVQTCPSGVNPVYVQNYDYVCQPCTRNDQCATSGQVCVGGSCAACTSNSQCSTPGQVCVGGVCGLCTSNTQCGPTAQCTATHTTSQCTCSVSTDCASGDVCVNGLCQAACTANSQCPAGQVCNAGVCGQCTETSQCGANGSTCEDSQCECTSSAECPAGEGCLTPFRWCGACAESSECASGQACIAGVCGPCSAFSDCPFGQACVGGACSPCTANSQCGGGQACVGGTCGTCFTSSQCGATGACNAGACTCTSSAECAAGQRCGSGVCVPM